MLAQIFGTSGDALDLGLVLTLLGAAVVAGKVWGTHHKNTETIESKLAAGVSERKELREEQRKLDRRLSKLEHGGQSGVYKTVEQP